MVRPGRTDSTVISHSSSAIRPRMSKLIRPSVSPPSPPGRSASQRSIACTTSPASGLKCCSSALHAPPACAVGLNARAPVRW